MESFDVVFKPSVQKDLRRLPKDLVGRALQVIESLKTDPCPRHALKLSARERTYRIRVGDYRIVYEVDTQAKQVTISYVRHRRDVYRNL